MAKIVKVIELMSESPKSWEDASQNVVKEAAKTLRNILGIHQRIHRGGRE
jgi:flavin-binding protein dodecin